MSEWGSAMTVDRKEPPKIRTRALDLLAAHCTYTYIYKYTLKHKYKYTSKHKYKYKLKHKYKNTLKHKYKIHIKKHTYKYT